MALERLLKGVKELVVDTYDNLSLMGKAGYLRLFTAVMPAVGVSCGDTITNNYYNYEGVQAKGCASETDCRDLEQCIYNNDLETQICYDSSGVADYAEGSSGGDDDVDGTCGGSPLVGRYLHNIPGCDLGMSQPMGEDCQGTFISLEDGSIFANFSYEGMRLSFDSNFGDSSFRNATLYPNPSASDISSLTTCFPGHEFTTEERERMQGIQEELLEYFQCVIEGGGSGLLYFAPNGLVCPSAGSEYSGTTLRLDNRSLRTKADCESVEGGNEGELEWEQYCEENFGSR